MKQWEAKENNNLINESEINWELVKHRINELMFNNNNQIITLPKNMQYVQGKTACASIGSNKVTIESRYIGFILGNNIIKVRIDEKTNNISIEVENDSNNLSN